MEESVILCPVLQYTDDTLIVVRDEIHMKKILDKFAAATGPHINFIKSTVVPTHVSPRTFTRVIRLPQCTRKRLSHKSTGACHSQICKPLLH
jgi:hypothetical protein